MPRGEGARRGGEMDGGDGLQWRQVLDQEWNPRCGNGRLDIVMSLGSEVRGTTGLVDLLQGINSS